jgi:hydrogenase maturation protease
VNAPLLVLGLGNPSRGDDALGPRFIEGLEGALDAEVRAGQLELITDFQLQIEHALDLEGRRLVVFVDASLEAAAPFTYHRVQPDRTITHTTHAMSPEAVLATQRRIGGEPPEAWLLAIRGESFELGEGLSAGAERHLGAALSFLCRRLRSAELGVER